MLKQDWLRNYFGSGSRVVDSSRNEHPSFAIDEQRSVIIADVERLEELGATNEVVYQKNQWEETKKHSNSKHFASELGEWRRRSFL